MSMRVAVIAGVLVALAVAVEAQTAATKGCTVTIQFDNDLRKISKTQKYDKILKVLADRVFYVPVNHVKQVGALDQSGIISSQSVISFHALGPTTNHKDACANCQDATARQWLGLRGSSLKHEIAKATDTWWPGDKAKVQKATCMASK